MHTLYIPYICRWVLYNKGLLGDNFYTILKISYKMLLIKPKRKIYENRYSS